MKYIKIYEFFKSEQTVSFLTDLFMKHFEQIVLPKLYDKTGSNKPFSYKITPIVVGYKNNHIISSMLKYFNEHSLTPSVIYHLSKPPMTSYTNDPRSGKGYIDVDCCVHVNLYNILNLPIIDSDEYKYIVLEVVKEVVSHELKHLYDDILQMGASYHVIKDRDKPYLLKWHEVTARISSFVNSDQDWKSPISELLKIFKNKYILIDMSAFDEKTRNKILKYAYQIIQYKRENPTLHDIKIVDFETKPAKKKSIDTIIEEFKKNKVTGLYNQLQRILEIDSTILKVVDVDGDTGMLTYPLLEQTLQLIGDNINITINDKEIDLVDTIKETYPNIDVKIIHIKKGVDSNYNIKEKTRQYLISKKNTIPEWVYVRNVSQGIDVDVILTEKMYKHKNLSNSSALKTFLKEKNAKKKKYFYQCAEHIINNGWLFSVPLNDINDLLDYTNLKVSSYTKLDSLKTEKHLAVFNIDDRFPDKKYKKTNIEL